MRLTQREVDETVANSNPKTLQNLREGKDREFMKFQRVTRAFPKQILRYQRWPGVVASRGGEKDEEEEEATSSTSDRAVPVLWMSKKAKSEWESRYSSSKTTTTETTTTTRCESCGGTRAFEFQIVPQILHFLALDLEFDSLVVFTCTNSCGEGVRREFVYVI